LKEYTSYEYILITSKYESSNFVFPGLFNLRAESLSKVGNSEIF
jgi:hypothetical protein